MEALPFPEHLLTDGRITLRAWTPDDAPAITAACQDRLIQRFITGVPSPYTENDADAYLALVEGYRQTGKSITFAIVNGADELLGTVGGNVSSASRSAEVGYWLAPQARGNGYATAALSLLCSYLFNELACERIELTTDPENLASQRVAASCGFRQEGYLRGKLHHISSGERRDAILWGRLKAAPAPESSQVIWLNGTFGAGKSSTAEELRRRHPGLVVLDPEYIGFVLRDFIPNPTRDFQDLPEWREVTVASVVSLARHQPGPLLVVMTLLRRDILLEIFTALRAQGVVVRHVLLDAPDPVLAARIDGDAAQPADAIAFRSAKLGVYRDARSWLRLTADQVVETAQRDVRAVADELETLLVRRS